MEFIEKLFPNVITYWDTLVQAIVETLQMVSVSLVIIIILGTLLGIVLAVISDGHLYENKLLNGIIPRFVDLIRAIPFVILLALLMGVTRFIVGTAIGVPGAIVPMVISLTPFVSRQIEMALLEIDEGVIEMARSMGFSKPYIIFRIMLNESRNGIIRSITLSSISLVSFSTMAGVVGGGGIGDFAIRYGYQYFKSDIMVVTILVIVVIVYLIQGMGDLIYRKLSHS